MKIDLHCHTKKVKTTEDESRNVSIDLFKEKIEEAEVKMIGITNHNYFNIEEYLQYKEAVKEYCYVMPGIELDVIGNKDHTQGHIILIANPDEVVKFANIVDKILGNTTPDNFSIDSHELYDIFKDMDIIYIAHFLKDKQLSKEDLNDLELYFNNSLRLLKEASNIVSIGVLQSNNHRAMIGSDVINWNEYETSTFGELKFDVKDFQHLLRLIDKDSILISDLINENFNKNIKVYGNSESKENPITIPIYDDINIIFGDKGSGKTEILLSLRDYYDEKGLKYTLYQGGDKESWYKSMIKTNASDYSYMNLEINDNYNGVFSLVNSYKDISPISVTNYYKYIKNDSKNKRKTKMKCLNISLFNSFTNKVYKSLFNDIKEIESFIDKAKKFEYTKMNEIEVENVINKLEELKKNIEKAYKEKWLEENSKKMTNNYIEKMNEFVSQNVGSPVKPIKTGLYEFIKNRIELKQVIDDFMNTLKKDNIKKEIVIGNLGLKGSVKLTTNYGFINENNKKLIDSCTLIKNKTDLSSIISDLESITKKIASSGVPKKINAIKEKTKKANIESIDDFISVSKLFTINGHKYKPSKGELAILSLQHDLLSKKDCDIFLIDEPETNLGSTYINDVIVPLLKELASARKVLVVATHDANIAIRTRPSCSILKTVDNEKYKTYIGNMFTDELKEIETKEVLSWRQESIKYLEGGKEAFSERGDLYE